MMRNVDARLAGLIAWAWGAIAACGGAQQSVPGDTTAMVDAGTPSDGVDAQAGPAQGPTACGPAELGSTAPKMLDQRFWGYHGIGTDGTYVYYPAEQDGKLYQRSLDGGPPTTLVDVPYLRRVKSRGARVCWLADSVIACRVGGTTTVVHRAPPHPGPESKDYHRDFDFDDRDAYWIDVNSVWRAPLDASGPAVKLIDGEEATRSIAVAGNRVVWSTDVFQVVRSCEKANCASATELASFGRPPQAIIGLMAGDADSVYVPVHLSDDRGRRGGNLVRIPAAGGTKQTLVECMEESPVAVFVEDGAAYLLAHSGTSAWDPESAHSEGGSIYALAPTGGGLRRLATGQAYPAHFATTPKQLMWINEWGRGGQIMTLAR